MNLSSQQGMTLIELMIVVAIIGLLATIGIPAYQDSVRKSNRADAQITLSRLATLEERYFFRTNQYTNDFADLVSGATSGSPITSDDGHYSVALSGGGSSWTMTATAIGAQADDTDCYKIIQTSLGNKTSQDSDGNTSTGCW